MGPERSIRPNLLYHSLENLVAALFGTCRLKKCDLFGGKKKRKRKVSQEDKPLREEAADSASKKESLLSSLPLTVS